MGEAGTLIVEHRDRDHLGYHESKRIRRQEGTCCYSALLRRPSGGQALRVQGGLSSLQPPSVAVNPAGCRILRTDCPPWFNYSGLLRAQLGIDMAVSSWLFPSPTMLCLWRPTMSEGGSALEWAPSAGALAAGTGGVAVELPAGLDFSVKQRQVLCSRRVPGREGAGSTLALTAPLAPSCRVPTVSSSLHFSRLYF